MVVDQVQKNLEALVELEVVELEDLEDDDVDPKDADVVHMVRRGDTRTSERYEYRDERR